MQQHCPPDQSYLTVTSPHLPGVDKMKGQRAEPPCSALWIPAALWTTVWLSSCEPGFVAAPILSYRAVLALHAGAVEAERCHSVADPLDVEDTLIPPLARLRLRQVLGLQCDGFNLPCWDQNLLRTHQLGTVLHQGRGRRAEQKKRFMLMNNQKGSTGSYEYVLLYFL